MSENAPEAGGGAAAANDSWGRAITLLTGYPMPDRSGVFEDLTSQHGIPLFDIVGIDHWPMQPVGRTSWGWQTHGFDYVVPFYETRSGNGAGLGVRMRGVNVRFIGTPPGQPLLGGGATLSEDRAAAEASSQWNRGQLAAYITGPTVALDALLQPPYYSTRHTTFSGLSVPDTAHVSLDSFQRTGMAFDRAALFFQGRSDVLMEWERSFGEEESPWRGQAAGAFWDLIHIIRQNYDGYVEQLGGRDFASGRTFLNGHAPRTQIADSLAWAQEALRHGAASLRAAWDHWAADGRHDPYRWVADEIRDLILWIVENNHLQVRTDDDSDIPQAPRAEMFSSSYHTTEAFRQDHDWGPLAYPSTWVRVAEAGIAKWNQHIDATIGVIAEQVTSHLSNNWRQARETAGDEVHKVATETPSQINSGADGNNLPDINDLFTVDGLDFNGLDGLFADDGAGGGGLLNPDRELGDLPGMDDLLGGGGGSSSDAGIGVDVPLNPDAGLGNLPDTDSLLGGGGGTATDAGVGGSGGTGGSVPLNPDIGLGDLPDPGGLLGGGEVPGGTGGDLPGGGGTPGGVIGDFPLNPGVPLLPTPGSSGGGLPAPPVTQLNPDGTLTTRYANGSSVALNPRQGTAVTTRPDGSTATTDLDDGPLFNPDGSVTVANPDGSITTTHQDGSVSVLDPDTGTLTALAPDGTLTTTFPDGTAVEVDPDSGLATTTDPDGGTTTTDLNNGSLETPHGGSVSLNPDTGALITTHPDGTTVTLDPATGNLVTERPDGTVTTLDPDKGTLTTTRPDGTTETTDLNGSVLPNTGSGSGSGGLNLPDDLDLEVPTFDSSDLASGSSGGGGSIPLNDGLTTVGGLGPGGSEESAYFDEDRDHDSVAGRGIGSPAQPAAASAGGGSPLNPGGADAVASSGMMPPGMMPPGMTAPGAGGAGGKDGGSERRREVYAGAQGTAGITPRRTGGRTPALDDEDVVVTRGRTATSSGTHVPGTGAYRRTESVGTRENWKPQDEDVWGTDEGGAPAVIGR
ncbi:AAWKG family protein [Streptomyces sp. NPDC059862]|uniref:AAWKG family protein n=1 Tax=Streptomyces sp. NPDC059862 TaxID=3346975 RepID=UPI00365B64F4